MADTQAPSPESLRLELQEAITSFRHQWTQLQQALGIIISADVVLLSYGFSQRLSSVLLVASLTPVVALGVYINGMTALVPICYVAIRLEGKLSLYDVPLIGTWVRHRGDLAAAISGFANLADRGASNSKLKVPVSFFLKDPRSLTVLVFFVLQVALVVISILGYHFRFM
jgi:hypothetical protein